jgi:hypothetical protein
MEMFNRRHYETIARDMKACLGFWIYQNSADARSIHALNCNQLATSFAAGNALFDRKRFLEACGLDAATIEAL